MPVVNGVAKHQTTKKEAAPTSENVFATAGQKTGLEIWRIEQLQVVPVKPEEYGKFYAGDSYIVLHTLLENPPSWNIHFWLGSTSSTDEQGVAAIKTVELDDHLGGSPVQHREVQGHESKQFLSYFKGGIRYLEGGVKSGFKHVDRDAYEKRLFQVKGKRNCRVKQVEVSKESLNQGDSFILDEGLTIHVWIGPNSSKPEKRKATEVARQIRDQERQGRAIINVIDEHWNTDPKFFAALGATPGGYIKTEAEGGDDAAHERKAETEIRLFKVSDASGRTEVTEIESRPLKPKHLDSADCFILDLGPTGVFAWVGKKCTKNEKDTVWKKAVEFLKVRGYPKYTPVTRVNEGNETAVFKQAFDWPVEAIQKTEIATNVAKIDPNAHRVDINSLRKQQAKGNEFMPDDGDGEVQVWRIENFFHRPLDKREYGTFYTGDSYVIQYKYLDHNVEKYIIYFWLGLKSSRDEQAAAAVTAANIDNKELNGQAMQIRVIQNKEPAHFLKIFSGKMVVLMGGHASGFKNLNDTDSYDTDGTRLFQVRDGRVIQVAEKAASLNSNDVFVLETPQRTFIWLGKGASEQEKALSKDFAKMVIPLKNPITVTEENEPPEFWSAIGGKGKYASGESLKTASASHPPRLFHCTNAVGYFRVEEVVNFSQEDLYEEDVMLLDAFDEVFIWIGKEANDTEKKEAMKTALEYIKTDPFGRTVDNTSILTIKQGFEPLAFTGHFGAWDAEKWSQGKTYEDLKKEFGEENIQVQKVTEALKIYTKTYTLAEITGPKLPEGVDPLRKEFHLHEEDFHKAFGISREEYTKLPQWKQLERKKKTGLY